MTTGSGKDKQHGKHGSRKSRGAKGENDTNLAKRLI
jgi:hypothetical protein